METAGVLCLGAFLGALGVGYVVGKTLVKNAERRPGSAASVVIADDLRGSRLAWYVRNGVGWTLPAARRMLRSRPLRRCAVEAVGHVRMKGFDSTEESLLSFFLAADVFAAVAGFAATGSWLCFAAVAACVFALGLAWARGIEERRREQMRQAVPDALRAMGVCFQSGLSLLQTFQQVSGETPEPLRSVFASATHRMELGGGTHGALDAMRSATSVSELAFVAVALDAQHQAGGSLQPVLDAARETVEGELELQRKLQVQTAQAKLSARVVSVMPFVLLAVFSLISEGFLNPFFESVQGVALLGVAFAMQAAGIVAVRKTLSVEVAS